MTILHIILRMGTWLYNGIAGIQSNNSTVTVSSNNISADTVDMIEIERKLRGDRIVIINML
jgi:hypothetical protein